MNKLLNEQELETKLIDILISYFRPEAIEKITALIQEQKQAHAEYVIGKSPENPYNKSSDRFFQEWGHQASEYDKFIRDSMRKRNVL